MSKPGTAKYKQTRRQPLSPTKQLWLAVTLYAVTTLFIREDNVPLWEADLFTLIYNLPDISLVVFLAITQMGNIYLFFVLALMLAIKKYYLIAIRLLMSGTLAYLLAGVAKDLAGRPRPIELLADIVHRDYLVRGAGFPSGHAALATAVALSLNSFLPRKYKWIVPAIIIAVGVSRVYLGVHLPLDVIAGIAIGWASYALFQHVQFKGIRRRKRKLARS